MRTDKYYFFWKHQFGQWTIAPIVDDCGRTYNCCEQYMMFWKAMFFNDLEIAREIISEKNPYEQQKLGRKVKRYNEDAWIKEREPIVYRGNFLKFTQHPELRTRLLETHPLLLVEASLDKIWGCGLTINNPQILDSRNWTGKNLLGKILTNVREDVMVQK